MVLNQGVMDKMNGKNYQAMQTIKIIQLINQGNLDPKLTGICQRIKIMATKVIYLFKWHKLMQR
jgi:hypothetical protein